MGLVLKLLSCSLSIIFLQSLFVWNTLNGPSTTWRNLVKKLMNWMPILIHYQHCRYRYRSLQSVSEFLKGSWRPLIVLERLQSSWEQTEYCELKRDFSIFQRTQRHLARYLKLGMEYASKGCKKNALGFRKLPWAREWYNDRPQVFQEEGCCW